jgi:hypothetical protein
VSQTSARRLFRADNTRTRARRPSDVLASRSSTLPTDTRFKRKKQTKNKSGKVQKQVARIQAQAVTASKSRETLANEQVPKRAFQGGPEEGVVRVFQCGPLREGAASASSAMIGYMAQSRGEVPVRGSSGRQALWCVYWACFRCTCLRPTRGCMPQTSWLNGTRNHHGCYLIQSWKPTDCSRRKSVSPALVLSQPSFLSDRGQILHRGRRDTIVRSLLAHIVR